MSGPTGSCCGNGVGSASGTDRPGPELGVQTAPELWGSLNWALILIWTDSCQDERLNWDEAAWELVLFSKCSPSLNEPWGRAARPPPFVCCQHSTPVHSDCSANKGGRVVEWLEQGTGIRTPGFYSKLQDRRVSSD